jgi:prepilin-type N-terminal cleavage/methylation domain-containing protein
MNNRKAFTLVELLVVIGIIAILVGLLLPAISQMHRSAQITGQKADFQAISTALTAYDADFGDYPRNNTLPTWSTTTLNAPAPIHLSLAAALMGAGPQVTQGPGGSTNISQYEIGDGADGLGFRAQTVNIAVGGSTSYTVTLSLTGSPPAVTLSALPVQLNSFVPGQTTGSITMSVGTIYEETVGFVVDATTATQLDLTAPPVFPSTADHAANDKYLIKIPTGKITPNYISADTFKVAFVPVNATLTGGPGSSLNYIGPAGEPLLLDRWGQVIQYFPRYGPASNRTNDSTLYGAASATVQAGPLYGYSQPKSVDATNGENAVWDFRDGAPFFSIASTTGLAEIWPVPPPNPSTANATYTFRPEWAIQWMLGDQNFADAISAPQALRNDGPYILISAGPDGPTRLNGGYCNFANPSTGALTDSSGNALTPSELLQMFIASGNVYNFDHP